MGVFSKFNANNNNNTNERKRRVRGDIKALADGRVYHIDYFGFDSGNYGEYAYFHVAEDTEHTYYGGKRVTQALRAIKNEGLSDDLKKEPARFVIQSFTRDNGNEIFYVDVVFGE